MKLLGLALFLACASTVSASLFPVGYLPTGTYTADENLPKIKEGAAAKGQHILYVYFATDINCPLSKAASMGVARSLWADTVVVYAPRERMQHVPQSVKAVLTNQHCGKFAPWFVVADPKTDAPISTFGYDHYKANAQVLLKNVKKKMTAARPAP